MGGGGGCGGWVLNCEVAQGGERDKRYILGLDGIKRRRSKEQTVFGCRMKFFRLL